MNPFKPIIKVDPIQQLDTEEGESNKDEEKSTTSSEISEQDSESDTTADDTEESKPTETLQIHNVCNTTMHDEYDLIHDEDDSSQDEHVTEIAPHTVNQEQNNGKEDKLLTTDFEVKMEN